MITENHFVCLTSGVPVPKNSHFRFVDTHHVKPDLHKDRSPQITSPSITYQFSIHKLKIILFQQYQHNETGGKGFPKIYKQRFSQSGPVVRQSAGKHLDPGSIPLKLAFLFKSVGVRTQSNCGLAPTINETFFSPKVLVYGQA